MLFKCLSLIIEADAQILLKPKVFACVEANFLHQTISVREASVDLVGRFITLRPELTNKYYKLLADRILDVGVSVRKRVIKIFRDVCLAQPDFEHLVDTCVRMLRRLLHDEDAIKKLVVDTFYTIWFAPLASSPSSSSSTTTTTAANSTTTTAGDKQDDAVLRRVLSIVDVVGELNAIAGSASADIFEQLFNYLLNVNTNATSNAGAALSANFDLGSTTAASATGGASAASAIAGGGGEALLPAKEELGAAELELAQQKSKEVVRSCKQIVDCLVQNVLNTEANTNATSLSNGVAYKRLVASFATLHLMSRVKPDHLIRHAETMLPYLNIKSTSAADNQIINSAAHIIACVVPLLHSPSNSFLVTLEESLCKLIFQGGMLVVSSCISCLGTVVNKLTGNYKLAADCLAKFYNNGVCVRRRFGETAMVITSVEQQQQLGQLKPMLFRVLFTLGLLAKHFDVDSAEMSSLCACTKQDLFDMFMYFVRSREPDVQQKALAGLGAFLTRYSEFMMRDEVKTLYLGYIDQQKVSFC